MAVPPLFTSSLIFEAWAIANQEGIQQAEVTGFTGAVHGEHDTFFWAPARPGRAVGWRAHPFSAKQTRTGVILTVRVLVDDLEGESLLEHLWTSFYLGGSLRNEFGPDLPAHTFPDGSLEHHIETRSSLIDRDQGFRYAGASGDRNGHAIDDEIARQQGYRGKILQGMCTFSICSAAAVDLLAGGDPDRLRRLACRFAGPTSPDRELKVSFYDAGVTEEGGRAVAFDASQDEALVIKHGRVELVP
jgi:acyl dehydratase